MPPADNTTTTSEIEWYFIYDPTQARLSSLGLMDWPREGRPMPPQSRRRPMPLSDFENQRLEICQKLSHLDGYAFTKDMLIAARLYTGYSAWRTHLGYPPQAPKVSCHEP